VSWLSLQSALLGLRASSQLVGTRYPLQEHTGRPDPPAGLLAGNNYQCAMLHGAIVDT